MVRLTFGFALAVAAGLGRWESPTTNLSQGWELAVEDSARRSDVPPTAWLQGDPADSLYRAARESLNQRDFRRAADLFAQLPTKYPKSGYAPDAYYWQAFALYRLGGEVDLRRGLQALQAQSKRYPKASTKGDAQALQARINGELARLGDPQATAEIQKTARAAMGGDTQDAHIPDHAAPDHDMDHDVAGHAGSDRCDDDGDDIRVGAINALMQMDHERARPILQKVLARRDAGSACLRQKAVFILSQGGGEGIERILVETVRNDPDAQVREQAVFWLSQVEGEAAVTALDSILRTSKDAGVREKALFALSQHDSPKSQQALRTFAERTDVSGELREKAIFWIGQSGGADNATYLRGLFGRLKDEELRNKVLFSISQMGGPENDKWLLGVARDRAQPLEVRKQALFWAGQAGVSMADLGTLYNTLDDPAMREQLIFVYSQRDETAAVDKLLEIARRDPNPEMRKKALFWLGQSDDPRAAKAIEDIIAQP
jgi:HEAT repeat protein